MWTEILLGAIGAAGTLSGWIAAWYSRGEALDAIRSTNQAIGESFTATTRAADAEHRALNAEAGRAAAALQLNALRRSDEVLQTALDRARRNQEVLLAQLAKAGVPVGGLLVDDALSELYSPVPTSGASGGGPSAGGDPVDLPADPAATPAAPEPGG